MQLYNSLVRKKIPFTPLAEKNVTMYVCGITPYDTTHLGHAFTYIVFDVLLRYLRHKGYQVNYTQNVTDIDDDILKKAKEIGKDWQQLGNEWTQKFQTDMKALNILTPTHYVKATESIPMMITIISKLLDQKHAYISGGNIYFARETFPSYGALSKLTKEQMLLIAKERGGNPDDPNRHNPLDFLLWQKRQQGEPFWSSPWGDGRPGWHIECSSMISQYLGDQIDIHGGGKDLIFPHHESEIAQSESFSNKSPFVGYWMHTAMVICDGEKMSKSLGNLVMVSDLLKKYSANAIRWYLLSHNYRKPWEYDEGELKACEVQVNRLYGMLTAFETKKTVKSTCVATFCKQMDDDLSIPKALTYIELLAKKLEKEKDKTKATALAGSVTALLDILGFFPVQ